MTAPYTIDRGSNSRRRLVEEWLFGLDQVSPTVRQDIVTAWVSTWSSSPYETLEAMPAAFGAEYKLMKHVNEVTRTGLDLARRAAAEWGLHFDPDIFVPILTLHDVDKPLMFVRDGDSIVYSKLYHELPHGVVGAMLLKELGFPHNVVSAVALHAGNAPYHAQSFEAYVLHYADFFAGDHMMLTLGKKPWYQK